MAKYRETPCKYYIVSPLVNVKKADPPVTKTIASVAISTSREQKPDIRTGNEIP